MNIQQNKLSTTPFISVVIPHMEGLTGVEESLKLCLNSLKGQYDELIVVRNDGEGFAKSVNQGINRSTGLYVCVINNDTRLIDGNLISLAKINSVVVPHIIPEPRDFNPRCFYCIDKILINKLIKQDGYFLDEKFKGGYFEDDDLIQRLQNMEFSIIYEPSVTIHHLNGGGLTMKQIGEKEHFDKNKKVYEEKWKTL